LQLCMIVKINNPCMFIVYIVSCCYNFNNLFFNEVIMYTNKVLINSEKSQFVIPYCTFPLSEAGGAGGGGRGRFNATLTPS